MIKTTFKTSALIIGIFILLLSTSCSSKKMIEESNVKLESMEKSLASCTTEKSELAKNLAKSKAELEAKNKELNSMKNIMSSEKAKLQKLKKELKDAFSGYDKGQVKIEDRDGQLIVVMQNKILYTSGKVDINEIGQEAITTMAQVFKNNKGLNILVESHTDDRPISNAKFKDNWDLSVARSVGVVRLLEAQGVNPTRMTAAGRGEFVPVMQITGDEDAARAANRRTEFIISPKLSGIYKMLGEI